MALNKFELYLLMKNLTMIIIRIIINYACMKKDEILTFTIIGICWHVSISYWDAYSRSSYFNIMLPLHSHIKTVYFVAKTWQSFQSLII